MESSKLKNIKYYLQEKKNLMPNTNKNQIIILFKKECKKIINES